MSEPFAGVGPAEPRPRADLAPLLRWLASGEPVPERRDFATGTAMPDGRLDMCKQSLGPAAAADLAAVLRPGPVKHLLLGTDGLGDTGAAEVAARAGDAQLSTLYLGCNGITATGACRIADNLRASPAVVTGLWLKRNPIETAGALAATEYAADSAVRTLDLVQTGLDAAAVALIAATLADAPHHGTAEWAQRHGPTVRKAAAYRARAASTSDPSTGDGGASETVGVAARTLEHDDHVDPKLAERFSGTDSKISMMDTESDALHLNFDGSPVDGSGNRTMAPVLDALYLSGNPLGPAGGAAVAPIIATGSVTELYLAAAGLSDQGAAAIADALTAAPQGRLTRLSLASNGIGPESLARVAVAAIAAGVEVLDFGRVKAARVLGAAANRIDEPAAARIAAALAANPHRLTHLVLADTALTSRGAQHLLDAAQRAATPTRHRLGKGIAASIRQRLNALSADLPIRPEPAPAVAAIRSVHRTAGPGREAR
ncbi:ribonuclease inhibitor [Glycomyces paridis]|nr:ribonuclease inhibitor [Glycomyces paridis]